MKYSAHVIKQGLMPASMHHLPVVVNLCLLLLCLAPPTQAASDYDQARQTLIRIIEKDVQETSIYLDKTALDPRVMAAMAKVPRHEFVPQEMRRLAYLNRPVPIGHGQTISQPYIVAIMTDLLQLKPGHKVLEIGTGSGYQAAILAEIVNKVFTLEIIKPLGERAASTLRRLQYQNVTARISDGYYGWKEHAPFDAIIVTAAAGHIPPPLLKQLKPGGRMMIPVGSQFMTQQLVLIEKDTQGVVRTRQILPVRFVPLTGKH